MRDFLLDINIKMAKSKQKVLKVELVKEFKSKDKVVYSNYGRFKVSKAGKIKLVFNDGEKERNIKANHA